MFRKYSNVILIYKNINLLQGFTGGPVVNNLPVMQEMWVCSLGLERSSRGRHGNSLQYFCLGNPMERKSQRRLAGCMGLKEWYTTELLNHQYHHWSDHISKSERQLDFTYVSNSTFNKYFWETFCVFVCKWSIWCRSDNFFILKNVIFNVLIIITKCYSFWLKFWASLIAQSVKESACNAGYPGSIPGSGRFPGKGNGNPLWSSCLENPIDTGAWQATIYGVARVK